MEMWVGSKKMTVNGGNSANDVALAIIGVRTYMPLRFVAENLSCSVAWDENTRCIP